MRRLFALVICLVATSPALAQWRIVSWNELGMHCMDGDYSVFSILPLYNTIHAQVISGGKLVRDANGLTLTYEAVADSEGSINTTSAGKTNFWEYSQALFGANLTVDQGLAGANMPGAENTPQPMTFDTANARFSAVGIPITPFDDEGRPNTFPHLKLVLRNASNTVLATNEIALPISEEIDCARCHASGSNPSARPPDGWTYDADPERDTRLNILKLHDGLSFMRGTFPSSLTTAGFAATGLAAAAESGTPILCAACHASNALGTGGLPDVPSLTAAMHAGHASAVTPDGAILENLSIRDACYLCHPGANTRCLRDAMGSAGTSTGTYAMECQGCHGPMSRVGSSARDGWLDEPQCGSCHTGSETTNSGSIRFTSVFDAPGHERVPASQLFAVSQGHLYRESKGHGGLYCPACHGAPHAILPSRESGDNLQSMSAMGSPGVLAECSACHPSEPSTTSGGPHGLHPVGQTWVKGHEGPAESGSSACRGCHASDMKGGPLSGALRTRNVSSKFGSLDLWRGSRVGCYSCHNGPDSESASRNAPPVVVGTTIRTSRAIAAQATITATDSNNDPLTLRVVDRPKHGSAGFSGRIVTYTPDPGFTGLDSFTFSAHDGLADSNLATVTVEVVKPSRKRPVRP